MASATYSIPSANRVSSSSAEKIRNGIRMNRILFLASLAISFALLTGCDRDKGKSKSQNSSSGATTTPSADSGPQVPRVGRPYFTKETYKPQIGKSGGRVVRDTIGEPKSFNPVTSGES